MFIWGRLVLHALGIVHWHSLRFRNEVDNLTLACLLGKSWLLLGAVAAGLFITPDTAHWHEVGC